MQNDRCVPVRELEDRDLLARLKRCVVEERCVTARLLEHFAEERAYGRAFMSERIDSARQARAERPCSSTGSTHLGSTEPS